MSNADVTSYDAVDTPTSDAGPATVLPAASVREVPPAEPESVVYRYVLRPATDMWHIWEETTGHRVTVHALRSRADAEDAIAAYNRLQTPPR